VAPAGIGGGNGGMVGRGIAVTGGGAGISNAGLGAASASDITAARDTRPDTRGWVAGSTTGSADRGIAGAGARSAAGDPPAATAPGGAIVITPPHTEQRARTPTVGTFDGSTRKTDRHSGHDTFTSPPPRKQRPPSTTAARPHPQRRRRGGRS
jgi:hypothetical protein